MKKIPTFTEWVELREGDYRTVAIDDIDTSSAQGRRPAQTQAFSPQSPKKPAYRVDPQKTQADMSLGNDAERTVMADPEKIKIMKLVQQLAQVDPRRAKWFAKMMEMPGNIGRIDRVANQIHTVQDLLKLISSIEQKERSRRANADTFVT